MIRTKSCIAHSSLIVFLASVSAYAQMPGEERSPNRVPRGSQEIRQVRAQLAPYIGAFLPLSDLLDERAGGERVTVRQKTGVAMGVRLTVWADESKGFEGAFVYSPAGGNMRDIYHDVIIDEGPTHAFVWAISARFVRSFRYTRALSRFHLLGGLAVIGHGGDYYTAVAGHGGNRSEFTDGKTDVGAVVGMGLRVPAGALMEFRADAETYLYSFKPLSGNEDVDDLIGAQFQADLVISVGLAFWLGR